MKLFIKLLVYTLIVIIGLTLSLLLIAELAENRISKMALKQVNEDIDAQISIKNIDFSLMRDFPLATVELQDVCISIEDDTLANIKHIYVSVETLPLIDEQFLITQITMEGGTSHYEIRKDGSTNLDALLGTSKEPSADSTSSSLNLELQNIELKNIFCSYQDDFSDIKACLLVQEMQASIEMNDSNTYASLEGTLLANNCHYPSSKLMLMEETTINLDMAYHNEHITIKKVNVETDGALLEATGIVKRQGSSFDTNINITSSSYNLEELLKYAPDSLLNVYELNDIKGLASMQATVKGLYNDSTMPLINAKLQLKQGSISMSDYPTVKNIYLSADYSNGIKRNNKTTILNIDTCQFTCAQSNVFLQGSINNLDRIKYTLKGKLNLQLYPLVPHLPDSLLEDMSGKLAVHFSTSGQVPNEFDAAFANSIIEKTKAQIELKQVNVQLNSLIQLKNWNGKLSYQNKHFTFENINGQLPSYPLIIKNGNITGSFDGNYNEMSSMSIDLSSFDIETSNSQIKGSTHITNLTHPNYSIDLNSTIDLAEFKPFAPDSLIKDMSGKINTVITSKGIINLDSIVDQSMAILFNSSSINTSFDNVKIAMQDSLIRVNKLNGELKLISDSLSIKNLSGKFADITFGSDSANIINIYNAYWLNQADTIKVDGNFNLGNIDYAFIEAFMAEDTVSNDSVTNNDENLEPTRYSIQVKGKVTAESFKYNKALFSNLSALYNVSDSLYIVDQFKFDAFKGRTNSSVKVQMLPNNVMKLNFKNKVENIDINQLLVDLDNLEDYGNNGYISHEQLSGNLSTDNLNGYILFKDSLITDSIMMSADLKLEEGHLTKYPIAAEMGKDYGIDGLDDLKFKTIDTKMFISTGSIYAPLTNIKTNTFDISLFGKQNFDLDCQYHLRFYLKEILRKGKTKRIEKKLADESKQKDDDGGTKGLSSLYAIYKVENEKTVKSALECKDSKARHNMKIDINLQEALLKLSFHPKIISYKTQVEDVNAK